MEPTFAQLLVLEPDLGLLEAEVRRRAAGHVGGSERWFTPLWYGTTGEPGIKGAMCSLVGHGRGHVSGRELLGDPAGGHRFPDEEDLAEAAARIRERDVQSGPAALLSSSDAYDVVYAHLANLLTTLLDRVPLPAALPVGCGWREWDTPRGVLVVDDRVAAAAALLEMAGDVLLAAVHERRSVGRTRSLHAVFALDGRLLAWDTLNFGVNRSVLEPGLRFDAAAAAQEHGQNWRAVLRARLGVLNTAWFGSELAAECGGYVQDLPADFAAGLLHAGGRRHNRPSWVSADVEHEIVGLAPITLHPGCARCGAARSWGTGVAAGR